MDIGVASVRNIYKIHWRRSLLWGLLALSSVPIHLLYNSAIFKTLSVNEYGAWAVNVDFLQGLEFANFETQGREVSYEEIDMTQSEYDDIRRIQHLFTNGTASNAADIQMLNNSDCMAAYGTSFVSGRTNVLAITSAPGNQTNNTVYFEYSLVYDADELAEESEPPFTWICTDVSPDNNVCNIAAARRNATNWTIDNKKIDYCLSQVVPSNCKLQFSVYILVAVILMNACKSFAMFATLYIEREPTLVTIGAYFAHPMLCETALTLCLHMCQVMLWSAFSRPRTS